MRCPSYPNIPDSADSVSWPNTGAGLMRGERADNRNDGVGPHYSIRHPVLGSDGVLHPHDQLGPRIRESLRRSRGMSLVRRLPFC